MVERLIRAGSTIATATIAYAETYSGLTRRHRDGDLTAAGFSQAREQFEAEWAGYLKVDLNEDVLSASRIVIQRYALRGFDGIHLASALVLQKGWNEPIVVAAADQRLLRAASDEGLGTHNVETGATSGPRRSSS